MKISDLDKLQFPDVPGIQGKEEYFNSVVLLLLIPIDGEYHIVFQKRNPGIRQGGEVCLPGGGAEEGDASLEMTAVREASEELGVPSGRIGIMGRLDTLVAMMGATVDVFVGIADFGIGDMNANPEEVEAVFTLPVSYFEQNEPDVYRVMVRVHPSYTDEKTGEEIVLLPSEELGLPGKYRKPWGGFKYRVLAYKTPQGVIWGITARIIGEFIGRLQA